MVGKLKILALCNTWPPKIIGGLPPDKTVKTPLFSLCRSLFRAVFKGEREQGQQVLFRVYVRGDISRIQRPV
jgi:hypothetical protein